MTKAELLKAIEPAKDDAEIVINVPASYLRDYEENDESLVGFSVKTADTCEFGVPEDKIDCHIMIDIDEIVMDSATFEIVNQHS